LESSQILSKTPREFSILMSAQIERTYDEYERFAAQAMMNRQAYHAKKLKQSQLFKRPAGEVGTDKTVEDVRDRQESIMNRLEQFEEFRGRFGERKE